MCQYLFTGIQFKIPDVRTGTIKCYLAFIISDGIKQRKKIDCFWGRHYFRTQVYSQRHALGLGLSAASWGNWSCSLLPADPVKPTTGTLFLCLPCLLLLVFHPSFHLTACLKSVNIPSLAYCCHLTASNLLTLLTHHLSFIRDRKIPEDINSP